MASMSAVAPQRATPVDEKTYRRRINAWSLYDWANSAFATTILAAFLPVYYSSVAGATLPSEATATAYWSISLSIALFISAIISPILGTISDVARGKKKLLAIFTGIGVLGTGLLVFVNTGDWLLASIFLIIGRIGFGGAIVFYDALLPHVAKEEDQDAVSTRGYALGYLGGGILLAINVVMFQFIPDSLFENAGVRLSFLSVGIWWALFSIPLFRQVPEPPADTSLSAGQTVTGESIRRLRKTFSEIRKYGELFKYLIAFLIYNDAIGTIIGLAAIYGAELGFGTLELVLALLLVQFVGIPFSLIFGSLPVRSGSTRRHFYLAFVIFNLVALPLVGIIGARALPLDVVGQEPPPYVTEDNFNGQGVYAVTDEALVATGDWQNITVTGTDQIPDGFLGQMTAALAGTPEDVDYAVSTQADDTYQIAVNGQQLRLTYAVGPDGGTLAVLVNDAPLTNANDEPVLINLYNETVRYNVMTTLSLPESGQQSVSLVNMGTTPEGSTGTAVRLASAEVLKPTRTGSLVTILGILLGLQALGIVFALIFGRFFIPLANRVDTRRSILLSLIIYGVIAAWGFILNSTIEFWFLAWMVSIVQGGSQALSRSLYANLSPVSKSGEFFGLFSIMSKLASIVGPLLFALAVVFFGSSRPAILSLIALFFIGGFLLTRVNIEEGMRHAREEDERVFGPQTT